MKNIFVLFCTLILFTSCSYLKAYKFVQNREVKFYDNKIISFNLTNNRIFLKDSLNYFLDLGGSSSFNVNSKHNFQFIDSIEVGKIVDFKGENLKNKIYLLKNISAPLFQSQNFYMSQFNSKLSCEEYYDVMIGADLFYDKNLFIDFENKNISVLDNYDEYLSDYSSLNVVRFNGKFFEVESNINEVPIVFKIDTGNPYGILINTETFNKLNQSITNKVFIDDELQLDYSNGKINFNDNPSEINILHNPRTVNNLLGVNFMKNYNWIFDFQNGKIFVKKNKNQHEKINSNRVVTRGNLLLIESYVSPKYNTEKRIVSIDEIVITDQNICHYKNLLNSTENWEIYNIKTSER
jgi:hypothetical protein